MSDSCSHSDRRAFLRGLAAGALGAALGVRVQEALGSQPAMLTRPVPRTGERVPAVGLGTWQTFDVAEGAAAEMARLEETLRVFYDAGGRVVDSSPMYGRSEAVVGALSTRMGLNGALWVATKVWTTGEQEGVRQMAESMAQLQRQRLELMQVHNLVDWRTHLRTLRRMKDAGTLRYIGVTHYVTGAFDDLERLVRGERLDFVQLPYSVGLRDAERRLLPAAADTGTAVIVNRPFEGGTLFRRVVGTPVPPAVAAYAASWPQAFLKFILAHPAVTCVIPGTGNPRHVRDNVGAGLGRLPDAREREALLRAVGA
jgi:diketogulonate reductase-like aldo/keto reductase